MSSPLVSILIPCYNSEAYVAEAIESALAQTYPHIEVIVIDDGSTDGSAEIIASFQDRIQWRSIPNQGACRARNVALSLAKGEFIQYLDADDLLMPEKIEHQLPTLLQDQADLVFCRGTIFGDGKAERAQKRVIRSPQNIDPFCYALSQGMSTLAPLHRRTFIDRIGGFRDGLPCAQELDLHVRLAAAGVRIHFEEILLVRVRHHPSPDRISQQSKPPGTVLENLIGLSEILTSNPIYTLTQERRQALAEFMAQHAIYAYRNGAQDIATKGFETARRLYPRFQVKERSWYRLAARGFGHLPIERLLAFARALRSQVLPA